MGNICKPKRKNINIITDINNVHKKESTNFDLSKSFDNKLIDYFYHIDKKGWEHILDFFTYKELTVIAQLNSKLRDISKNPRILNKFFLEKDIPTEAEKNEKINNKKNQIFVSKTNKSNFQIFKPKNFDKISSDSNSKEKISNEIKMKKDNKSKTLILKTDNLNDNKSKTNKNLTPYLDFFTNKKIQIQPKTLYFNGYTASVCSSSVGYYDHTPSFSDENFSNRKSIVNITNITTIHINHCP